jgi:hypothetical protein
VTAVVAIAVRCEDRRYTMAGEPPDRLSMNTRRLTGVAAGTWMPSSSGH